MEQELKKTIEPSDKECKMCKEMHYIPEDKDYCLPCSAKEYNKKIT